MFHAKRFRFIQQHDASASESAYVPYVAGFLRRKKKNAAHKCRLPVPGKYQFLSVILRKPLLFHTVGTWPEDTVTPPEFPVLPASVATSSHSMVSALPSASVVKPRVDLVGDVAAYFLTNLLSERCARAMMRSGVFLSSG